VCVEFASHLTLTLLRGKDGACVSSRMYNSLPVELEYNAYSYTSRVRVFEISIASYTQVDEVEPRCRPYGLACGT